MTVKFSAHAEAVMRHYFGEPNPGLSKPGRELRWGERGSIKLDLESGTWADFEQKEQGGLLDLIKLREGYTEDAECFAFMRELGCDVPEPERRERPQARRGKGGGGRGRSKTVAAIYDYVDEAGELLFQAVRFEPKEFRQRRTLPDGSVVWSISEGLFGRKQGADTWRKLKGGERADETREMPAVRQVPYRLPEVLAAIHDGRTVFVVEGEKDVATLEGWGLTATCNAGGAGGWRVEFGPLFAGADVVALADNDAPGRSHAADVCALLRPHAKRLRCVEMGDVAPDLPEKGDVTDWAEAGGGSAEALARFVDAAPDWTPSLPVPPFPVFSFGDLVTYRPKEEWLVDGWLGEGQLGVLFGKPKSGKSFAALDLSMHIAHGWDWLDWIRVREGGVFYVAAEGGDGVKKRVAAWAAEYPERRDDVPFVMAPHRFDLFDGEASVAAIVSYVRAVEGATGQKFRLIVVDTLARVFGGGDENFAGDMNKIIESCDRLRAETGCAVLLVHHSAKADGAGMRGSSALYGAVDAVWEMKPMEDDEKEEIPNLKTLTLRDQKDGEAGASLTVALRQRILGHDDAGRPVTSCIVEAVQDPGRGAGRGDAPGNRPKAKSKRPSKDPAGASDQAIIDAAFAALKAAISREGEDTPEGKAVAGSAWAAQFAGGMDALRDVARALIGRQLAIRVQVGSRTLYAINDCPF